MITRHPAPGTAAARLKFQRDGHIYRLDGRIVPGVSDIIEPLTGLENVPRRYLERAAELGTWLHDAIAFDLDGVLDLDTVPDEIMPEFAAWVEWRAEAEAEGWQWLAWERRVCHPGLGYAGTLDLVAIGPYRDLVVIDHKRTAEFPRSVGPQTIGYAMALAAEFELHQTPRRFCLHLQPSQKAKLYPLLDDTLDERAFLAALTVHTWRNAA